MMYGHTNSNPESRFLKEIDEELLEIEKKNNSLMSHKIEKENMYNETEVEYNIGDVVIHTIYGRGVVVGLENSIVTIAFSRAYGIRKLMKNHKSLKKI